jgi:hypothetical protein
MASSIAPAVLRLPLMLNFLSVNHADIFQALLSNFQILYKNSIAPVELFYKFIAKHQHKRYASCI